MEPKEPHLYPHFRTALAVSFLLVLLLMLFLAIQGKRSSFLIINGHYNPVLDIFFQFMTLLGDGLIYIPIVVYSLVFNRRFFVPVIAGIIICTLLTHFFKQVVFPNELRPFSLETERIIIHKVKGVPLHRLHSFPSGHTATAFTMALLLAAIIKRKVWAFVLPLIAFFVGYSRVYLAQHFPTDVGAGMVIGMVSACLSLWIYRRYNKRLTLKRREKTGA